MISLSISLLRPTDLKREGLKPVHIRNGSRTLITQVVGSNPTRATTNMTCNVQCREVKKKPTRVGFFTRIRRAFLLSTTSGADSDLVFDCLHAVDFHGDVARSSLLQGVFCEA